jgi:hypothetical protein
LAASFSVHTLDTCLQVLRLRALAPFKWTFRWSAGLEERAETACLSEFRDFLIDPPGTHVPRFVWLSVAANYIIHALMLSIAAPWVYM